MIIWFVWFTAVAWTTSRCEPPVNSYLPPESGFGNGNRPSQEYGQPDTNSQARPGFGRSGGRNQPQDSYSPFGQQPPNPPSSQYGPPGSAGGAGPKRGFGSSSQNPNQGFGRPNSPHEEYGTPNQLNQHEDQGFSGQDSISSSYSPSNNKARPGASTGQRNFGQNGNGNNQRPDSSYGTPNNQNRAPSGINGGFGNNQRQDNSFSPAQRDQQSAKRQPFQQPESSYGPPPAGNPRDNNLSGQGQRNNAQQTPSSSYISPNQERNGLNNQQPSTSYGTPGFEGNSGSFGENSGGESNEPAKYEFNYDVDDSQTGTLFGHSEHRDGDTTMGMYNVVLPDGRKQVVEYEAGRQGYKPQIRYEGGSKGGQGSSFESGGSQGGSQGYPSGRPNDNQLNNNAGGYQNAKQNTPSQYQQQPTPEIESGYPRDIPGGLGNNNLNQAANEYPRQQGHQNGPGTGYPRDEPLRGRQFNNEDTPNDGFGSSRNAQRGVRPQGSANSGRGYPNNGSQQDNNGLGGQGPQRGSDFDSPGNEGYPRGGPNNQGGRNSPGRGALSGGDEGYPPRGSPDGPRGSGY